MKLTAFVAAVLLGTTAMAQTADAPKPPAWTFALKGFVSMSAAYQQGAFGSSEGQHSLFSQTGVSPVPDKDSLTFDVRQSRFNFSVKGPQVLFGATPSAVMELDFFQGFGGGPNGNVSLLNRLRVLYSELNWGNHKLQFGQQNDLVFAMAPTSLSHIAQPLGYYTGNVGWRRPGVFGYHTLPVDSDLKLELAWEIGRSQWNDAAASIGGNTENQPGGVGLGEASGAPALEGRVTVNYSKYLTAWAAAHWQQIDLSGYGSGASPATKANIATTAYNAGVKVTVPIEGDMGLTLQGTGFVGKNVAPLVGLSQFKVDVNANDVNAYGWWAQAGFNFTKEFSLWGLYGDQQIKKSDYARAGFGSGTGGAYENSTTNVIAMYRDGGYGLSAEWIHFDTKYPTAGGTSVAAPITASRTAKSDQYMVTANYFF